MLTVERLDDVSWMVPAFNGCDYIGSPESPPEDQEPRRGPGTFGEVQIGLLEQAVRVIERQEALEAAGQDPWAPPGGQLVLHPQRLPAYINFRSSPLGVELVWISGSGATERVEVYGLKPGSPAAAAVAAHAPARRSILTRSTTMPVAMLLIAGSCLLDARRRRGAASPLSSSGPALADAGPKNESAGTTLAGVAPTQSPSSDQNRSPGPLNTPDAIALADLAQVQLASGFGHSRFQPRRSNHGQPHVRRSATSS